MLGDTNNVQFIWNVHFKNKCKFTKCYYAMTDTESV